MAIDFGDDVDPAQRETALTFPNRPLIDNKVRVFDGPVRVEIPLTVAEQRAIVEADVGEPVIRMWLSADEWERVKDLVDWTAHPLSDGRIGIWRKRADLDAIMSKNVQLWSNICERIIEDDVI